MVVSQKHISPILSTHKHVVMRAMVIIYLCNGVELALLLELAVDDAVAVGILGRDLWPLVNAIEQGDGHAASHVRLNVAVEEEGTRVDDLVANDHPGAVYFVGLSGVLDIS